jgi:hypothetical protein
MGHYATPVLLDASAAEIRGRGARRIGGSSFNEVASPTLAAADIKPEPHGAPKIIPPVIKSHTPDPPAMPPSKTKKLFAGRWEGNMTVKPASNDPYAQFPIRKFPAQLKRERKGWDSNPR